MPAKSKAQQRLFGLARAVQKGDVPSSKVTAPAKKIARDVKRKDVDDFASTPTKGLPDRVKKEELAVEALKEKLRPHVEKIIEARSIGAIKIKKLKGIVTDMWKRNHNVREDDIIKKLPSDWWDTWEMADQEIRRIVSDELMNLAHGRNETVSEPKSALARLQEKLGRELSVPEKHQLAIAYKTMKMPTAMVGVMGGPNKAEAKAIIKKLTGKDYKERKESINEDSWKSLSRKEVEERLRFAQEHLADLEKLKNKPKQPKQDERENLPFAYRTAKENVAMWKKRLASIPKNKKESVNEAPESITEAKEQVMFAVKKGDSSWREQVITTDPAKFAAAKKWAEQNGFHKIRIVTIDPTVAPDFSKTLNKEQIEEAKKNWKCQECGKEYSNPVKVCSKCGSYDIDVINK